MSFRFFLILGIALRCLVFVLCRGTNDITTWERFAESVTSQGVAATYFNSPDFNHPPLMALLLWICHFISLQIGSWSFSWVFRSVPLVADIFTLHLLGKLAARDHIDSRAALVYSLSIPAILVSGFHGNTDSLCVFFVVGALWYAYQRKFYAVGLLLGFACNVKIIPLLLFLPLVSACVLTDRTKLDLTQAVRISVGFTVAFLPALAFMMIVSPVSLRNIFAYRSLSEAWGLGLGSFINWQGKTLWRQGLAQYGTLLIGVSTIVISSVQLFLRRWKLHEIITLTFLVFLIFAPGFGFQYLMYPAPFIPLVSAWKGAAFSGLAGLFMLVGYAVNLTGEFPLYADFKGTMSTPVVILGQCLWFFLIYLFIRLLADVKCGLGED